MPSIFLPRFITELRHISPPLRTPNPHRRALNNASEVLLPPDSWRFRSFVPSILEPSLALALNPHSLFRSSPFTPWIEALEFASGFYPFIRIFTATCSNSQARIASKCRVTILHHQNDIHVSFLGFVQELPSAPLRQDI